MHRATVQCNHRTNYYTNANILRKLSTTVEFEMDGPLTIATFSKPPHNFLNQKEFAGFDESILNTIEAKERAFLTLADG